MAYVKDTFLGSSFKKKILKNYMKCVSYWLIILLFLPSVIHHRSLWIWKNMLPTSPTIWWVCTKISETHFFRACYGSSCRRRFCFQVTLSLTNMAVDFKILEWAKAFFPFFFNISMLIGAAYSNFQQALHFWS